MTTRQDLQLHGVLKGDLKRAIRAINDALLTTLGGCGDQERNIMCCPAPWNDRLHGEIHQTLADARDRPHPDHAGVQRDLARRRSRGIESSPIRRTRSTVSNTCPRKFKTAIAIEGDNCVDIYANDLGLVAHADDDGSAGRIRSARRWRYGPHGEQAEHVAGSGATARRTCARSTLSRRREQSLRCSGTTAIGPIDVMHA